MNEEQQNALLRLFSRLSLSLKIDIFTNQKKIFFKLKEKNSDVDLSILTYCALILSIENYANEKNDFEKLRISDLDKNQILKFTSNKAKLFISKQARIQTKRDKLLKFWAVVKTLKEKENFSFRQICDYLKKYHKLDVAHSTIYNLYVELEK